MKVRKAADDAVAEATKVAGPWVLRRWATRLHESPNYKWFALAVVSTAVMLVSHVDQGMVSVALPAMTLDMGVSVTTVQWVVAAYLLAITSLVLPFGRLSDMVGKERIFTLGYAIFAVSSGLCGVSQNVEQLIFFRILQGIGTGMVLSVNVAIVSSVFPARELGRALGVFNAVVAVGTMVGPSLGGFIVDAFDWRTAFFLRVPVGLAGVGAALLVFKASPLPAARARFDLLGTLTVGASIVALMLAVGQGSSIGWSSPLIIGLFVGSLVSLGGFVVVERLAKSPLVDFLIFRIRLVAVAIACQFLSFFTVFAVSVLAPFYLVQVAGYQAWQTGLILSVQAAVMGIFAPLCGYIADRMGSRLLSTAGLATSALGLFLLGLLGTQPSLTHILVVFGVLGLGTGLFQAPNNRAIMGCVPRDKMGVASAMVPLMRNLGSVLGVGVFTAVFASRLVAFGSEIGGGQLVGQIADPELMVMAFRDTYFAAAAITIVAAIISASRGSTETVRSDGD